MSTTRDARLPDEAGATARVYGDKRPKVHPPYRARVVVAKTAANEHGGW